MCKVLLLLLLSLLFIPFSFPAYSRIPVAANEEGRCRPRRGPQNGQVSYTVRNGGLVARFRCQPGRKLSGNPFAVCLGGIWRHPVPRCLSRTDDREENSDADRAAGRMVLAFGKKRTFARPLQNDGPVTSYGRKYQKAGSHVKKKKDKRKSKQKLKTKAPEGHQLEQDGEFLSELDVSCLVGSGGAGFIKAPEVSHAVVKYARKKNEQGPSQNRYLLATYECVKGFVLKNRRNDRMFCSRGQWLGAKPKCQKQEAKAETSGNESSLCAVNRGGCEHVCTEVRKKVVCSCYRGFRSDGNRCVDVDECEINNGGCEHTCKNQLGSFACSCPTGLQLSSNGKTCVDINECLSRNGHGPCQDTCTNHWGGYQCGCEGIPGTQLSEDNHTCEDIDECKSGAAGCSHSCINALGRAFCQCPPGLELGEDWKTCQDVDECDDELIENSCEFGCINTVGSYRCATGSEGNEVASKAETKGFGECSAGYRGDSEGKCVDVDECKENSHNCSHECVNREGGYECSCPDGYDLDEDEMTCEDYDECAEDTDPEHNCSQKCINEVGSYRCDCYDGYTLDSNAMSCSDIDECSAQPCAHECKNLPGGYACVCPEGFSLRNRTECVDVDECLAGSHNCSHECVNLPGRYECRCPSGTVSRDGDCVDVNECETDNGNCSQLCRNKEAGWECDCSDGYRLVNSTECEDVDECGGSDGVGPCSHGCLNSPGGYSCLCPEGFFPAGDSCLDLDECAIDNGNCSHACRNYDGGYLCECPLGYRLVDSVLCEDVDECEAENGGCSTLCENIPGSFVCGCLDGYLLAADGKCEDVDECAVDNGNCSHACHNTAGGFRCSCPDNFELGENNRTCSAVDPCLVENGGCHQVCGTAEGTTICSCFDGYLLSEDNRTCEDACSRCEHLCERSPEGNGTCACRPGYQLSQDEVSCTDVDECKIEAPCEQVCVNVEGSFECDCHDGYRLLEGDNSTCTDVDECLEWEYDAEYYDNKLDYGDPKNLCSHTCVNLPGGYTCHCPRGHVLSDDDRTCVDVNECLNDNGGCDQICVNREGSFACECEPGYRLHGLLSCLDVDECAVDNGNCSHRCENARGGFACVCDSGYVLRGDNRTCGRTCTLDNGKCSHLCTEREGVVRCECPPGFLLPSPEALTCEDVDECARDNGGCEHECKNTAGGFECVCSEGYASSGTSCVLIDLCHGDNGNCSQTCSFRNGTVSCSCRKGYLLDDDGRSCVCPEGFFDTDLDCRDLDECHEGVSNCSDLCANTVGSYQCECSVGLKLAADGRTCTDVNECLVENGGCSQECVNTIGSYHCACRKGFILENGTNCAEEDLCRVHNGGCHQICKTRSGKVKCSCFPGYTKNGTSCDDVDECEGDHECDQLCVNVPGSYRCKCKPGYQSDGRRCTDVDECSAASCPGKKCVNTIGSYYCDCHQGYKLINDQCIDINECTTQRPCPGRCINTVGSYKCVCHSGFWEKNGICVDINECEFENGGCSHICINFQGSYKCLCPAGYELYNSSCKDINECSDSNGGCDHFCINTQGSYICNCKEHFYLLDDRKTCRVNGQSCSKLSPPTFGEIICPQFPPATDEFPIHAECYIRCHKGYKLIGDAQRFCTSNGDWSGRNTECIPLPCPKLRSPENGHFIPSSCTTGKNSPSHHCILACDKGYHVQGRAVLTCLTSQQWNSPIPSCTKGISTLSTPLPWRFARAGNIQRGLVTWPMMKADLATAVDVFLADTPPPYIQCAPDIKIELPAQKLSVYVKIPQPKSNVDWWRYVEAHPPWAKKLEGEFVLGTTTIMFQARNPTSNLTAACRLLIHVYDNEKPRVAECPESFVVKMSPKETGKMVTWKEPIFSDNVKIEKVEKSKEPGTLLRPGYHPIRYTATDTSGNKAVCNFTVTVKYDEKVSPVHGKEPFRKVIICPQPTARHGEEIYPSYIVPARCFVQRHRLTRVLTGFTDYQTYQNHGVRHQHDRTNSNSRAMKDYYEKRRESVGDAAAGRGSSGGNTLMQAKGQETISYGGDDDRDRDETIFMDPEVVIDQKNHQSDLARWQETVKRYRATSIPSLASSNRERNIRLLEMETKRRFEEERLRKHELEMMRWRENMKRYHIEMKRLQEDSRRYRAG